MCREQQGYLGLRLKQLDFIPCMATMTTLNFWHVCYWLAFRRCTCLRCKRTRLKVCIGACLMLEMIGYPSHQISVTRFKGPLLFATF